MDTTSPVAAEILESSASGFAAAANAVLQTRRPSAAENESGAWQLHMQQRVLELAAAVRVGEPKLFSSRISWLRRAAAARKADDSDILLALESLNEALQSELPEFVSSSVQPIVDLALEESRLPVAAEASAIDPASDSGRLALDYIAACLDSSKMNPIDLIMQAIEDGLSPQDIYCRVLVPAQQEVGSLWHTGDFSVAEERLVSETTRRVMSILAARFAPKQATGGTVLAASVAGNAHDIGLRTVSDLFALAGWRTVFLGANVPSADIAQAVRDYDIDLAVLTATLTPQLKAMTKAIAAINEASPDTRVLVGGIAFQESGDTWQTVGADGFADNIERAVEVGARLLEQPVERG